MRIVFRNEENGWTVLELQDDSGEDITAVGIMPPCMPGERIVVEGAYTDHPVYGRQLRANHVATLAPATLGALEQYLSSGMIKGVGAATARRIVEAFGEDTLGVLESEPQKIAEIPGIGKARAKMIAQSYKAQRHLQDILMQMQSYGITIRQAMKFHQHYGADCIARLEENPYQLIDDVEGVGFKTADAIALKMGVEYHARKRLCAGIKYTINLARGEGHTYLPRDILLQGAVRVLQAEEEPIEEALDALLLEGALHQTMLEEVPVIYLPALFYMESEAAKKLLALNQKPADTATLDLRAELQALETSTGITLADQQRNAVLSAMREGVLVITGGPGTGKTTILQFILRILDRLSMDFALCAPTGRAAKRMTEATGFDASTIHRLLEYGKEGQASFARNQEDPLFFDVIVVDEMSMVDLPLFFALLRALPAGTRLVLVGDADQLPPVGAGTVLNDIIKSQTLPVIRLTEIYRQSERSGIVTNAHRINNGLPPMFDEESDFRLLPCATAEDALMRVLRICTGQDEGAGLRDPFRDIQVLSPTKKGPLGVKALNVRLQAAMNPPSIDKAEREYGETLFREGDKVMQIRNNYRIAWAKQSRTGLAELGEGVYNGDLGTVLRIDLMEQVLQVLFDDERLVEYAFGQLEELELAYCISIHKSQGSEFPIVLLPIFNGPPILMTRNLLYTGVTRARKAVLVIGDMQSVQRMVENRHYRTRYSALGARMQMLLPIMGGE